MWTVRVDRKAFKDLARLGTVDQRRVQSFIDNRLSQIDNPRQLGSPLVGHLAGLWRYRVGDIRIVARIEDEKLIILVIAAGNRSTIHR
ncbi:MAG: type II toxin-antitoxin system RelE/ParE family toxin [Alphaproteobacteria bacterium]|nr:type II toxin-antitoxin system RelE/ParE family toxin [Alphaproteobacteria bacterium]